MRVSNVKLQGQKSLALDTAIGMWQLLFAEKQWPFVDHWCQFLQVALNNYYLHLLLNNYTRWFVAMWLHCPVFNIVLDDGHCTVFQIILQIILTDT